MSGFELLAVVAAVSAAGAYLLRRARRTLVKHSEGGCCGRCPVARPRAGH
jgi:hypothetical protein